MEIVRRLFERWMLGEWDAPELQALYSEQVHPEFEFVLSRRWFPDGGVHRGMAAALKAFREFRAAWEEFAPAEPEFFDRGDRVVVLNKIRGTGEGSGVEVEAEVGSVITFLDGKILRLMFCDRAEALEAAGLSE